MKSRVLACAALVSATLLLMLALPVRPVRSAAANNIFGLNLTTYYHEPGYLRAAADWVNSNGGDWGYVTVLVDETQRRDPSRFQEFLDQAAAYHLIPIVRLATHRHGQYWAKPAADAPEQWQQFFSGMRWPSANRYLVVGNEPNLANEWGGEIRPGEYAAYLDRMARALSVRFGGTFRVLNAPMDLSAPTIPGEALEEFIYLQGMEEAVPDIFSKVDAWASNPYQFSSASDSRHTILGYRDELAFLQRSMPVFILETGVANLGGGMTAGEIGAFFASSYRQWLQDPLVTAVTPIAYSPEAQQYLYFTAFPSGDVERRSPTYNSVLAIPKAHGDPSFTPAFNSSPATTRTRALTDVRYFPETGYTVHWGFKRYWENNGGLSLFGYPVSEQFMEEGRAVQYFERARFEYFPAYKETPYEVQLGLLGRLATAGRQFPRAAPFTNSASRVLFSETGYSLGGGFLQFWRANGGLAVFGYPISEEFPEVSPTDGKTYTVQYFERERFEYHPESAGTPYEVQLGLLGAELRKRLYGEQAAR